MLRLLEPEKIIIYRSQGEKAVDDFFYGGGMFAQGFITNTVIGDIALLLLVVTVLLVGMAYIPKRRRF